MRKLLMASTALILGIGSAAAQVTISPGQSIQAAVNANPAGTIFQLSSGTYSGQQFQAKSGDQFIGAAGGGTVLNGGGMSSPMLSANGATGVVIKNLSVQNYQTGAQEAPIHTGAGWQILNVTSTGNGAAGLYVGGANNLVQGGNFSNNGQEGIAGSRADGSVIEGAVINGNNTKNYDKGFECGGLKITETNGLTIQGNTVQGNNGPGIWGDIDDSNWTVKDNGIAGNNGNGVMYEISHGATTITENLIADNTGSAVYVSNSDGVSVTNNGVVIKPGNTMGGDGQGGGIVLWTNSGRGNAPDGTPHLSINDSMTGNTIVADTAQAAQAMSGVFSVLGTMANDVNSGNTYLAAGNAANAAMQAAAQAVARAANTAAQAVSNAATQAASTVTAAIAPVLKATSSTIASKASPPATSAGPIAPETSMAGPASAASVPPLPPESTPVQASSLPDPPPVAIAAPPDCLNPGQAYQVIDTSTDQSATDAADASYAEQQACWQSRIAAVKAQIQQLASARAAASAAQ